MRNRWQLAVLFLGALALALAATVLVAPGEPAGAGPAANVDRRLYIAGDSVILGIQRTYQQGLPGWETRFEAMGGSRTDHFVARIDALRRDEGYVFPAVVVVLYGNNEFSFANFQRGIDTIQQRLRRSHVVWLNLADWNPRNGTYNAALDRAAARYPNMEIADWRGTVRDHPSAVGDDGIHLTATGARLMNALIRRHVEAFAGDPAACRESTNPPPPEARDTSAGGYWLLDSSGAVHAHGPGAAHFGDAAPLDGSGAVGLAARPQRDGYWILDGTGAVHARGGAAHLGDLRGTALAAPPSRIESTPTGEGYWIVAGDGGVFAFGDAPFYGSMGDRPLNAQVRAVGATPRGDGYYLVAGDGGVFAFGDAPFMGSTGERRLNGHVVTLAPRPQADGYWLYATDGGVFTFGDAPFLGSLPGLGRCFTPRAVSLRPTATGRGYWIATAAGEVLAFGDAPHWGDRPVLTAGAMVTDMAVAR